MRTLRSDSDPACFDDGRCIVLGQQRGADDSGDDDNQHGPHSECRRPGSAQVIQPDADDDHRNDQESKGSIAEFSLENQANQSDLDW